MSFVYVMREAKMLKEALLDVFLGTSIFFTITFFMGTYFEIFSVLELRMQPAYGFIIVLATANLFAAFIYSRESRATRQVFYMAYIFVGILFTVLGTIGTFTGWFLPVGWYIYLTNIGLGVVIAAPLSDAVLVIEEKID